MGAEATALGLPRAFGDATYIAAPLILGAVSDSVGDTIPGVSCALAGLCIMIGSSALLEYLRVKNRVSVLFEIFVYEFTTILFNPSHSHPSSASKTEKRTTAYNSSQSIALILE